MTNGMPSGRFTKLPDTFVNHFLRLLWPAELRLFLVILKETRFQPAELVKFRARELRRLADVSARAFPVTVRRLAEGHLIDCHLQGADWYIMALPENHWDLETFKNRKNKPLTRIFHQ